MKFGDTVKILGEDNLYQLIGFTLGRDGRRLIVLQAVYNYVKSIKCVYEEDLIDIREE